MADDSSNYHRRIYPTKTLGGVFMSGNNIVPRSTLARNGQPSPGEQAARIWAEEQAARLAQALADTEARQQEIAAIKWQPTFFDRIAAKWGGGR